MGTIKDVKAPAPAATATASTIVGDRLAAVVAAGDICGALLASEDGLVVAHAVESSQSPEKLAAMCSALSALCDAAAEESLVGRCNEVIIEAKQGRLLSMSVGYRGARCVLMVVSKPSAPLGRVLWTARSLVAAIEAVG